MRILTGIDVLTPVHVQGNIRISFVKNATLTTAVGYELPFAEITQQTLIELMKQVGGTVKAITIAVRHGHTPFKFCYEGEVDQEELVGTIRIALALAAQEASNNGLRDVAHKLDEITQLAYR